jgi:hypothetical protein
VKLVAMLDLVGDEGDRDYVRIPELVEIYGEK